MFEKQIVLSLHYKILIMKKIIYSAALILAVQLTVSAQDHTTAPKEAPKKQTNSSATSTKHESSETKTTGDSKSEVSNAPAASSNTNEGTATPTKRKTRMAVNEKGVPK
jgi:uncharacterized low-complexity protein